jgi:hypothetical protein
MGPANESCENCSTVGFEREGIFHCDAEGAVYVKGVAFDVCKECAAAVLGSKGNAESVERTQQRPGPECYLCS